MRGRLAPATVLALLAALVAVLPSTGAATDAPIVSGRAQARYRLPPSAPRIDYRNSGFRQVVEGDALLVEVDASAADWTRARFEPPTVGDDGPPEPIVLLAHDAARVARTRGEAVARVLHAIAERVRYQAGPDEPLTARATIASGHGSCVGRSNLAVAALGAVGVPARVVRGALIDRATGASTPHRWLEVFYPDAGWVFSDPTESIDYVSHLHVVLTPPSAPDPDYHPVIAARHPPRLIAEVDGLLAVDVDPRRASALAERRLGWTQFRATVLGESDASGVLTLEGASGRRRLEVRAGRPFSFPGLVAGSYQLHARFPERGTSSSQRVSLLDGELRRVAVTAP